MTYRISLLVLVAVATITSPHPAHAWTFVISGDSRDDGGGSGVNELILDEIATEIVTQNAEFVLFPGDLVNGSSDPVVLENQLLTWRNTMQPVYNEGISVYPVRGNHETGSLTAWNNVFTGSYALPSNGPTGETNLTFSATHNNVYIAGMDNYIVDARVNQPWLASELAANEQPHVLVFGHEPAYKAHHTDCLDDRAASRDAFWSNLSVAGAKAYFCGHDHFYDHAHIDDGDADPTNDLHQYIVGTAGAPLRDWTPLYNGDNGDTTPTNILHEKQYGYVLGEVDGNDITLTWMHRTGTGTYEATTDVLSYTAADGQQTEFATFQQGVDGYTSTVDTYIHEASPDTNYASSTTLSVDTQDPNPYRTQTLLRFDNLFGYGAGQVPMFDDVTINWAATELDSTNEGDGAALHRMLTPWSDTDTWNSLSGGIQTDGIEAATVDDVTTRFVRTNKGTADVTASLQAWMGTTDPNGNNNGWAMVPSGSNGWDFYSAEGSTAPMLMIDYSVPEPATTIDTQYDAVHRTDTSPRYDIDSDGGAADQQDVDQLVEVYYDTRYGDANLDGAVNINDGSSVTSNWQGTGKGWAEGDFNGDDQVTINDGSYITSNWQWERGGLEGGDPSATTTPASDEGLVSQDAGDPAGHTNSGSLVGDSIIINLGSGIPYDGVAIYEVMVGNDVLTVEDYQGGVGYYDGLDVLSKDGAAPNWVAVFTSQQDRVDEATSEGFGELTGNNLLSAVAFDTGVNADVSKLVAGSALWLVYQYLGEDPQFYLIAEGVPEPGTLVLAAIAALGLAWFVRRRR